MLRAGKSTLHAFLLTQAICHHLVEKETRAQIEHLWALSHMSKLGFQEHEVLRLLHEDMKGQGEGNGFFSPSTQAKHPQAPPLPSVSVLILPRTRTTPRLGQPEPAAGCPGSHGLRTSTQRPKQRGSHLSTKLPMLREQMVSQMPPHATPSKPSLVRPSQARALKSPWAALSPSPHIWPVMKSTDPHFITGLTACLLCAP